MAAMVTAEGLGTSVLQTLRELGIDVETVPYREGAERQGMKGMFCKNLLLKDRKAQFYLVIYPEDKTVDLKQLKKELNAHRNFSFSSPEDLEQLLGCKPGAVSPFGIVHDDQGKVKVVLDLCLKSVSCQLNFHPLDATLTSLISFDDLLKFLTHYHHQPVFAAVKSDDET